MANEIPMYAWLILGLMSVWMLIGLLTSVRWLAELRIHINNDRILIHRGSELCYSHASANEE